MLIKNLFIIGACALTPLDAGADTSPQKAIREMSTDRPDRTESAYTVPEGHLQLETDLVSITQEEGDRSTSFNNMNLKYGLTANSDIQFIFETYGVDREASGIGNTTLRYKFNLFGNDDGAVAIALMPYLSLPTQAESRGKSSFEGGLILPISLQAPHEIGIGVMFEIDQVRNSQDSGYDTQVVSSLTASHPLFLGLNGYLEIFSQSNSTRETGWVGTLDAGLTLPVGQNIQWDVGTNVGITPAAEDFTAFLGFTIRH